MHYRVTDARADPIGTSQPFTVLPVFVLVTIRDAAHRLSITFQVLTFLVLCIMWPQEKLTRLPQTFLCFTPHCSTPAVGSVYEYAKILRILDDSICGL
jgi:hypothetical protein